MVKNPHANAGDMRDMGSIPDLGRYPGGGHGNLTILAWRIPWTERPSGLQSTPSQRVGYNLSDLVYTESANKQNPNTELFMELDIMIFKFI